MRNLVIDLRRMNATAPAIGLHWQVSQSTSLINVVVEMSQENGTQHQGTRSHDLHRYLIDPNPLSRTFHGKRKVRLGSWNTTDGILTSYVSGGFMGGMYSDSRLP